MSGSCPNPHYEPDLRPLTGPTTAIVEFVNLAGRSMTFYARLFPLLDYLLPQYLAEGKAHLVVGIGCTGGRHRSVAIAEFLADRYREQGGVHGRRGAPGHRQAGMSGVAVEALSVRAPGGIGSPEPVSLSGAAQRAGRRGSLAGRTRRPGGLAWLCE